MKSNFDIEKYHSILCPDYPDFLDSYLRVLLIQRLSGVGLLCGTDWTPLFHNKFFYSRLNHSIGVALIVWNFTHDKKQTLAGLVHDIATPAFSHVVDFMNGDASTQESTEASTKKIINEDIELSELLFSQGIYKYEIDDYHKYPIADNEVPGLSADRLEYMYPSGAALEGVWTIEEIAGNYSQIAVLKNEKGCDELGFVSLEAALEYTEKFCRISRILQKNEDKVAMQLMADILSRAIELHYIMEEDLYVMDESYLIRKFDNIARRRLDAEFTKLYSTFRTMKEVVGSDTPISGAYCVSLDVKKRYVNPLVKNSSGVAERLSDVSKEGRECIDDFLNFKDSRYGCVYWA